MAAKRVLIAGGGVAGLQAALDLAAAGIEVVLAEKEATLGGHVAGFSSLFPHLNDGREMSRKMIDRIKGQPGITVLAATKVTAVDRDSGGFVVAMDGAGTDDRAFFDAVLLATGYRNFAAEKYGEYGYDRYQGVITSIDFEKQWPELATQPLKTVVFIQCVGARDRSKGMPYCSKVCCMYTAKQAAEVRDALPDTQVYVFYMDIRANFHHGEEFVRGVMEKQRVRYIRGRVAKVFPAGSRLIVRAEDTLMGVPLEMETDLVVLASAMVPEQETAELARRVGGAADDYGFVAPPFESIRDQPMSIAPGVFYAGACGFPTDAKDAIMQGSAAASGILAYLLSGEKGRMER
ncbi:MAG: FAD-dependent oxidoreductase [Negativicutes bacterium]|nr:FAD-dependent oxidoreductase [Negativicutes bacterium]